MGIGMRQRHLGWLQSSSNRKIEVSGSPFDNQTFAVIVSDNGREQQEILTWHDLECNERALELRLDSAIRDLGEVLRQRAGVAM